MVAFLDPRVRLGEGFERALVRVLAQGDPDIDQRAAVKRRITPAAASRRMRSLTLEAARSTLFQISARDLRETARARIHFCAPHRATEASKQEVVGVQMLDLRVLDNDLVFPELDHDIPVFLGHVIVLQVFPILNSRDF